jgi:hypothetical protein
VAGTVTTITIIQIYPESAYCRDRESAVQTCIRIGQYHAKHTALRRRSSTRPEDTAMAAQQGHVVDEKKIKSGMSAEGFG